MKSLAAGLLIMVALVLTAYVHQHARSESKRHIITIDPVTTAIWRDRIKTEGGVAAYREFKSEYGQTRNTHLAIHFIGEQLYRELGEQAMSICDDDFGSGCYHQVMSSLLLDGGKFNLASIASICETIPQPGSCFHGAGHGFMEFYRPNLQEALDECRQFGTRLHQCAEGVFMEYNHPFTTETESDEVVLPAQFDPSQPLAPCTGLDVAFQPACVYALPSLWFLQPATVPEVIERCELVDANIKDECYKGMGIAMPAAVDYDPVRVFEACKLVPYARGREHCLDVSVMTLSSLGKDAKSLERLRARAAGSRE